VWVLLSVVYLYFDSTISHCPSRFSSFHCGIP
jgi:hypothetical protein